MVLHWPIFTESPTISHQDENLFFEVSYNLLWMTLHKISWHHQQIKRIRAGEITKHAEFRSQQG